MSVMSLYDEDGRRIAQIDGDHSVCHVIAEHGAEIEVSITVKVGKWEYPADLPVCRDVWCSTCHPTCDIPARPAWGEVRTPSRPADVPSAFAYLNGEPHA
jgi:hypothetical protein